MTKRPQLSDEDMARVEEYLSSPIHQVERKPFRFFLIFTVCWTVVAILGGFSYFFAKMMGFV